MLGFLLFGGVAYGVYQAMRHLGRYQNHCYCCKSRIDSFVNKRCRTCGWFICSNCGHCGCGFVR